MSKIYLLQKQSMYCEQYFNRLPSLSRMSIQQSDVKRGMTVLSFFQSAMRSKRYEPKNLLSRKWEKVWLCCHLLDAFTSCVWLCVFACVCVCLCVFVCDVCVMCVFVVFTKVLEILKDILFALWRPSILYFYNSFILKNSTI